MLDEGWMFGRCQTRRYRLDIKGDSWHENVDDGTYLSIQVKVNSRGLVTKVRGETVDRIGLGFVDASKTRL